MTQTQTDSTALIASYPAISLSAGDGILLNSGGLPGTAGQLSMDPLPINGITLNLDVPAVSPTVQLNALGVKISAGPPGVGASLELGPTGITLQFGPPGVGSSIKIDPTGITLQVGPMTKIQLLPTGLMMQGLIAQLTANTSLTVTAGLLTETATGPVSRTAMATTIM